MGIAGKSADTELVAIREHAKVRVHPNSGKVGFVFPVYMGALPELVKSFLQGFPFRQEVYYSQFQLIIPIKGWRCR
ncbi:MAG: hypothetical protein LUD02_10260 [Tannerellaceae bacterium]|nr:hypothetical protein [Tannerellaceae bacterium]